MPLTGRFRHRKSLWGNLLLQFEHDDPPAWSFFAHGARRRRWRTAQLNDLVQAEVRGLLEFEDYVARIPEANHSPRIGPLSRRGLPHEATQPPADGRTDNEGESPQSRIRHAA